MAEKVITIETVDDNEYEGKAYKKVMGTNGLFYNVKQGKGGSLKAKWDLLKPGAQIKLILGEFKGKRFVQDIELIKETTEASLAESPNLLSRELNTIIMTVKDLWIAGKLTNNDPEVKALRKVILLRLKSEEMIVTPVKTPVETPQKIAQPGEEPIKQEKPEDKGGGICAIHNVPFELCQLGGEKWWAHKIDDRWCEKPPEAPKTLIEAAKEMGAVEAAQPLNLGMLRAALVKKGYKTEASQKAILVISDWGEIKDLKAVMKRIKDLKEKDPTAQKQEIKQIACPVSGGQTIGNSLRNLPSRARAR